jgi:small subunit ribosomal protein S6
MRRYESVWVVHGDLPDEEVKTTIDKFTRIITTQGGILVGVGDWGRRKLAYKIKGTGRGYYVVADFAGSPAAVKELERNYRIDDRIIRYHTVKTADEVNLEALQAEIAGKAKAAVPPEVEAPPAAEAVAAEAEAPVPESPPEPAPPGEAAKAVDSPASQAQEE